MKDERSTRREFANFKSNTFMICMIVLYHQSSTKVVLGKFSEVL